MKKLSIITCTYNSEKYLQECIDSVIAQKLNISEYEHIFVDAYSTDKTKKIIKKYESEYTNVKVIERKPKGVYNAMNEGIKEAKGEYIMCLNSDDYLVDNVLDDYLNFITKTGDKDLYYGILNICKNGTVYNGGARAIGLKKWLFNNFGSNVLIFHPTVLVKKDTLFELGLFDEDKKIASDYGMWLSFLKAGKKLIFFPKEVTIFRDHEGSLSSTSDNNYISKNEMVYYRKKYLSRINYKICVCLDYLLNIYGNILSFFLEKKFF